MTFEQEQLYRAAKGLVNDAATQEVLRRLEARAVDDWKNSDPLDEGKRMSAYQLVRAIAAFRSELEAIAAEPTVEQFNRRLRAAK